MVTQIAYVAAGNAELRLQKVRYGIRVRCAVGKIAESVASFRVRVLVDPNDERKELWKLPKKKSKLLEVQEMIGKGRTHVPQQLLRPSRRWVMAPFSRSQLEACVWRL